MENGEGKLLVVSGAFVFVSVCAFVCFFSVSEEMGPSLDSVLGYGLRQLRQLLDHLQHRIIRNLLHCALQVSVLAGDLGYFEDLLDNLWHANVHDLFTGPHRNSLLRRWDTMLRYHVGNIVYNYLSHDGRMTSILQDLEPPRMQWVHGQVCAMTEDRCEQILHLIKMCT